MTNQKKYVVLTGTTIDFTNVFGPFTLKEAEKFKQRFDQNCCDLWYDGSDVVTIPRPDPAAIVKVNGPYSWSAKVVTGK
jgi:hypothetical protein